MLLRNTPDAIANGLTGGDELAWLSEISLMLSSDKDLRRTLQLVLGVICNYLKPHSARIEFSAGPCADLTIEIGASKANELAVPITVPLIMSCQRVGLLEVESPHVAISEPRVHSFLHLVAFILGQHVQIATLKQKSESEITAEEATTFANKATRGQVDLTRFRPVNLVGNSKGMEAVYEQIRQVTQSDTSVLILGESGVGKELVASAIHKNSGRGGKLLVKVNCAALPETLLESELFGHERGSFTGALHQKKGRFELANGGTIFLDEIGDFSPATQVKLLRVLQEREFERLGGTSSIKADVRVISATNRNLEEMISEGRFRQDLYYRLNVFPIVVPPLRDRKTDIILLADHFVEKFNRILKKKVRRISTPAIDMLMSYHWPGNVRELENCIERAVLLTRDDVIHSHQLPPSLQTAVVSGTYDPASLPGALKAYEREMLVEALKTARGNMAQAARALGLSERVMGLRVKKYGIDVRRFRQIQ